MHDPRCPQLDGHGAAPEAIVEAVIAAYEPYLRMVVRRSLADSLRAKFDSADVVQSVWIHMLRALRGGAWDIRDNAALRSLLTTVARRRLISRVRHHRSTLEHERASDDCLDQLSDNHQPRPSEFARADELREQILAHCPAEHQEIVRLRSQGYSLGEIATRTGLHEGSVRRALRQLARRLALDETAIATEPSPECHP